MGRNTLTGTEKQGKKRQDDRDTTVIETQRSGTQRPLPSWRQSGRTEGEGTARAPHPGKNGGGPVEQRGHQHTQFKVYPRLGGGAGRRGRDAGARPASSLLASAAPCWLPLRCSGRKREEAAVFRPRTLFIPFAHHTPTTACPTPCPLLHRVPPGPAGGAGVLPVTLLAQSSRAV
uniref:Uncharacterized protein n=1 Tax=Gorilla gorilla gorilla TaxID=9595 RepID=A0A2I2Y4H6_GORGO